MEWTQSDTLALAGVNCAHCNGTGMVNAKKGGEYPCKCVLRAIFRACYARFVECATKEKHLSQVRLDRSPSGGKVTWGRKDEEYAADFILVTKRTLSPEEWQIFSWHYLLGADYMLCCRRLKMDRGLYFHSIYRIQQKLGRMYRELEPYGLFPLDEYFNGTQEDESCWQPPKVAVMRPNSLHHSLRVPVRKAA
jgi:hypothetical protein